MLKQLGNGGIESMANKIGANSQQTSSALEGIVPTLLGAMSNNSQSKSGASGLLGALDRDHDGSILDDVSGFIGNSDNGPGEGILKHVLGGNRNTVENGLSAKTGLNTSQVGQLLKIAAPLIMGYLGKQKKQQGSGFDLGSIAGLLGGMSNTSDKSTGLDLGDILQVVGGLSGGNSGAQRSGGIGGLLGKLFGK
ncbi:MAG: DUF937 domain-containing protein [Bacteroidetes bacterium]|nr:DUF937 domain-containing protein [Bacteroidota bacterium]